MPKGLEKYISGKYSWAISGIALLLIQYFLSKINIPVGVVGDAAREALSDLTKGMFWVGLGLIFGSVIYTTVSEKIIAVWKDILLPDLGARVKDVSNEFVSVIKADQLSKVLAAADKNDIEDNLTSIYEKLYGIHCTKEKGLYNYLNKHLIPFLKPDKVHRSRYTKKISIDKTDKGHTWDERCEFSLHAVDLDPDYSEIPEGKTAEYVLRYIPSMQINEGEHQKIDDFWKLKIMVCSDDEEESEANTVFDSTKVLSFDQKNKLIVSKEFLDTTVTIEPSVENGIFECKFEKILTLSKPFTKIVIIETSLVPENYFTLATREPSSGMDIDIHLPAGWIFEDHNVFNPHKEWSVSLHPQNRLSCHTDAWVLPGLILNCIWKEKE